MAIDFSQLVSALTNKFERLSNKSNVITDDTQTGDDTKYTTIQAVRTWVTSKLSSKQDTLVGSGTGQNIKTVNNNNLVGSGNINIEGALYYGDDETIELDSTNNKFSVKSDFVATTTDNGLMSSSDKTKLNGIDTGANKYVLPKASSSALGGVIINGGNLSIDSNGKLTATDTTYSDATQSVHGLMSTSDKVKLDGVETGANKYTLPTASDGTLGGVKVGNNLNINSSTGVLSAVDTTYNDATTTTHGLLTASDKVKLDSITVANLELITNRKTSVSSSSTDSEYPTSKAVYTAISSAIAGVTQFDYEVVTALPSTGVKGKIYLLANTKGDNDYYDEYIWIVVDGTGKFEKIGTTKIDLTNYYTKTETDSAIDTDISTHNSSSDAHSTLLSGYATTTNLSDHTSNTTVHITANERTSWNSRLTESNLQTAFNDLADAIDDIT